MAPNTPNKNGIDGTLERKDVETARKEDYNNEGEMLISDRNPEIEGVETLIFEDGQQNPLNQFQHLITSNERGLESNSQTNYMLSNTNSVTKINDILK